MARMTSFNRFAAPLPPRVSIAATLSLLLLSGCNASDTTSGDITDDSSTITSLSIVYARPLAAPLGEFDTVTVRALALDQRGREVPGADVQWRWESGGDVWTSFRLSEGRVHIELGRSEMTISATIAGTNPLARTILTIKPVLRESVAFWSDGHDLYPIVTPPGFVNVVPLALNDRGTVVGYMDTGKGGLGRRAFIRKDGKFIFPAGGNAGAASAATSVNGLDVVAGWAGSNAFVWSESEGMSLLPRAGSYSAMAKAINDAGEVAGDLYAGEGYTLRAFRWSPRTGLSFLPVTGAHDSFAVGLTFAGAVLGEEGISDALVARNFTERKTVIWSVDGEQIPLPCCSVTASSINDRGEVVGITNSKAFRWDAANGLTQIAADFPSSWAVAINRNGDAVGTWGNVGLHTNAFVWKGDGTVVTINRPGSVSSITPTAISDNGSIVGYFK
ncbi:MAG TPA: hypothetical protein VF042_01235 [Gemmatimonadaceae bacterium]